MNAADDTAASLADAQRSFNSSLDAGTRRAIDIFEGDEIDAVAFTAPIREAVALKRISAPR